ncbi:MAG: hypothetical protein M3Y42_12495 [Actinomycetota bacterium]|nr:hypothetical protein [Actinomycetota bacterium]MDQ2957772.1 hypothetical protein [Actinomycetota bacterium]
MSMRARLITLAVVCLLAVGGAVGYALSLHSKRTAQNSSAPPVAQASLSSVESAPRIVFRSTALGSSYGKIAMVSLADPAGPRALTATSCDRVYASSAKILCLSSEQGIVTTYQAQVLGTGLQAEKSLPLAGIPSRARLSLDGTLAATTSFTAGDSYAGTSFSTRTVISTLAGQSANANLEDYQLIHNGSRIKPVDRNFWGVTFAHDDNTFYATAAWGGKTYLVRGDIKARTVTTLQTDAECPSLSPDGTTVVYKKRNGQPAGHWRLASYDVATGKETLLAETRNVDDQVDWLDSHTVIYGIPRSGSQAAIDDIYAVPSDGTGSPRMLIAQAWSPAVVH